MKTMKTVRAYLSTLLIAALVFASLPVVAAPTAPQGMDLVSTQSVLAGDRAGADRERINEILARADVQDHLHGWLPLQMARRGTIAAAPDEVKRLRHFAEMPD